MFCFRLDDWQDLGPGCCQLDFNTALFNGGLGDLDACKNKCLEFKEQCKYIVHGWSASDWCSVFSSNIPCKPLLKGPNDCGAGGGDNGVHSYERKPGTFQVVIS